MPPRRRRLTTQVWPILTFLTTVLLFYIILLSSSSQQEATKPPLLTIDFLLRWETWARTAGTNKDAPIHPLFSVRVFALKQQLIEAEVNIDALQQQILKPSQWLEIPEDFDWLNYRLSFASPEGAWLHWCYFGAAAGVPYPSKNVSMPFPVIKPIAIYFPQFHQDKTNDRIWHSGWTDFTWLATSADHIRNQKVARPLWGYYDLLAKDIRRKQATVAQSYGIHGFAIYHYWFAGKSVLDGVLKKLLEDGEPDIPFYLIWVNESWNKRWDLGSNEVFLRQSYERDSWAAHWQFLRTIFHHKNYVKIDKKPVYLVTLWGDILRQPLGKEMLTYLSEQAMLDGFDGIYFVQVFNLYDDSNVPNEVTAVGTERQPGHVLAHPPANIVVQATDDDLLRPIEGGAVFIDRKKAWKEITLQSKAKPIYWRGGYTAWDNSPRILGCRGWLNRTTFSQPTIHLGGSPVDFMIFLLRQFENIRREPNPLPHENFFLLNAWNEWGEGNFLEPEVHTGAAYLESLRKSLETYTSSEQYLHRILSVNHEVYLLVDPVPADIVHKFSGAHFFYLSGNSDYLSLCSELPCEGAYYQKYWVVPQERGYLKAEINRMHTSKIVVADAWTTLDRLRALEDLQLPILVHNLSWSYFFGAISPNPGAKNVADSEAYHLMIRSYGRAEQERLQALRALIHRAFQVTTSDSALLAFVARVFPAVRISH